MPDQNCNFNKEHNTFVQHLIEMESIKTWSLIVTMFGDVDQDQLSGKQIGAFLNPAGIKPEAIRVALHRLRKDQWIKTQKQGREVIYSLTPDARKETEAAYARVYGQTPQFPDGWQIVLKPEEELTVAQSTPKVAITKSIALVPKTLHMQLHDLPVAITTRDIPNWFEDRIVTETSRNMARQLAQIAQSAPPDLTIRLLLLHRWRRLALRDSVWAHISLFPDGDLAKCQKATTDYLAQTSVLQIETH